MTSGSRLILNSRVCLMKNHSFSYSAVMFKNDAHSMYYSMQKNNLNVCWLLFWYMASFIQLPSILKYPHFILDYGRHIFNPNWASLCLNSCVWILSNVESKSVYLSRQFPLLYSAFNLTWQRCIHLALMPEVIQLLLISNCLSHNTYNLSGTATFIAHSEEAPTLP